MPQRKSVLPKFCYSKAFWILVPILITSAFSGFAAINAQLETLDDRIRANEVTIAENNVPELKQYIAKEFDGLNGKVDRNSEILLDNYKLLCKISQGDC